MFAAPAPDFFLPAAPASALDFFPKRLRLLMIFFQAASAPISAPLPAPAPRRVGQDYLAYTLKKGLPVAFLKKTFQDLKV